MELRTIAIVGASGLGCRVARLSALAGFHTILEDISPLGLEQGIVWIARSLDTEVSQGKMAAALRDVALANLTSVNSARDASREADVIIEAVSDELEMKIELFTIFDKFAKPGSIFASTTSSFSITDLASVTFCRDRCIGMRFKGSSHQFERLELVKGRDTSQETIAACNEVGRCMRLEVSVLKEETIEHLKNDA